MTLLRAVLLAGLASAPGLALAQAQQPPNQSPRELFTQLILADAHTVPAVDQLLRSGGGLVSRITFADLTGDGRSDAIVTVDNRGVAGTVALYVFSAHGSPSSTLRAVYRHQSLYQGRARVAGATLTLVTPAFARGDDPCCPRHELERDYAWNVAKHTLLRRASRTVVPAP